MLFMAHEVQGRLLHPEFTGHSSRELGPTPGPRDVASLSKRRAALLAAGGALHPQAQQPDRAVVLAKPGGKAGETKELGGVTRLLDPVHLDRVPKGKRRQPRQELLPADGGMLRLGAPKRHAVHRREQVPVYHMGQDRSETRVQHQPTIEGRPGALFLLGPAHPGQLAVVVDVVTEQIPRLGAVAQRRGDLLPAGNAPRRGGVAGQVENHAGQDAIAFTEAVEVGARDVRTRGRGTAEVPAPREGVIETRQRKGWVRGQCPTEPVIGLRPAPGAPAALAIQVGLQSGKRHPGQGGGPARLLPGLQAEQLTHQQTHQRKGAVHRALDAALQGPAAAHRGERSAHHEAGTLLDNAAGQH